MCIYQLVKKYHEVIDSYIIRSAYPGYNQFILNKQRRIWHVKNNDTLRQWAKDRGVKI